MQNDIRLLAAAGGTTGYEQIMNTQGNLVGGSVVSDRYQSTSSLRDNSSASVRQESTGGTTSGTIRLRDTDHSEVTSGPGYEARADFVDDAQTTGPSVNTARMSEQYHQDYGIYEESLSDTIFFYSTVSNGSITDQAVSLDIPAGIRFTMEKDGTEIPYASGQKVSEYGTYLLKLTAIEDESLPFSEQTVTEGVFRFRIMAKAPETETADSGFSGGVTGVTGGTGYYSSGGSTFFGGTGSSGNTGSTGIGDSIQSTIDTALSGGLSQETETEAQTEADTRTDASQTEAAETEESGGPEDGAYGDVMGEDGSIDGTALDEALSGALGEGYGAETLEGYNDETGLASAYDPTTGYYRHELISGEVFYTDVPNGMITNNPVVLLTNDNLPFRVLRDGEEIEYQQGTPISEAGSYTVFPHAEGTIYLSSYADKNEPLFHFRVVTGPVNDLGIFTAPEGAVLTSVTIGRRKEAVTEETAESAQRVTLPGAPAAETELRSGAAQRPEREELTLTEDWFYLEDEGSYTFYMDTEAGPSTVTIEKDVTAPLFYISEENNRISFVYATQDAVRARVLSNGREIYSGAPLSEISDPGSYTYEVYDSAGNMSGADVSLSYHMNTAAILFIIMILLFAAIIVVAVKRFRQNMRVV
ncbi:MAG: hypothetical protein Q4C63_03085 [Eubacteriales bacterium]|nr:hypothetical protein [Eubacteriales bacterium]